MVSKPFLSGFGKIPSPGSTKFPAKQIAVGMNWLACSLSMRWSGAPWKRKISGYPSAVNGTGRTPGSTPGACYGGISQLYIISLYQAGLSSNPNTRRIRSWLKYVAALSVTGNTQQKTWSPLMAQEFVLAVWYGIPGPVATAETISGGKMRW